MYPELELGRPDSGASHFAQDRRGLEVRFRIGLCLRCLRGTVGRCYGVLSEILLGRSADV